MNLSVALSLVLASLVSALPARADGGGTYALHADLALARQEVGAVRIGGEVYVAGGLLQGFATTDTVEVYDVANDAWSFAPSMPAPRHHAAVAAVGTRMFVIGGYPGVFVPTSTVFVFDSATQVWSNGPPLPVALGAAWAVAVGARIYVFGGEDAAGTARRTTFIFDTQTSTWTQGADMQVAREHLTAATLGGFIHVVGGRAGPATNAHERYDPQTDSWTTLAPLPTARSATATAEFGGRLFVMGGEVPMLFDVNEVYDPVNDAWTTNAPLPVPRHGIAAVTLDDRILLPAGGVVQGLQPTTHCDSFVPEPFASALAFCFCATGAPCGNTDASAGCRNSTGLGARLATCGSASVSADDLVLVATQLPPTEFGLVFMGTASTLLPLGDGIRCVDFGAGGLFRFPVRLSDPAGTAREGPGLIAYTTTTNPAPGQIVAGATWNFQMWHRDVGSCGSGSNLTNALAVTFEP